MLEVLGTTLVLSEGFFYFIEKACVGNSYNVKMRLAFYAKACVPVPSKGLGSFKMA